jgi:carboxymethylenebutenolidase
VSAIVETGYGFGVHEYILDVCRRLAQLGYQAIAPELFFRQGDVSQLKSVQEILANVVAKVPDAQVMADLDACAAWASAQGGDAARVGITGFCWGGRISWLYAAQRPKLKAAVAWYGRLDGLSNELTPTYPLDVVAAIQVPVLGLYGGQDQNIPVADVERMQSLLDQGRSGSRLQLYPDAPHAFHADYRPSYRAAAAGDGWQRLQQWFKEQGL